MLVKVGNKQELGGVIRRARRRLGMTMSDLETASGVSLSTISRMERGYGSWLDNYISIFEVLNLHVMIDTGVKGDLDGPFSENKICQS